MAVDYEKKGRIAIFTINRPEAMNAQNAQVRRELNEAMIDFRDNPTCGLALLLGLVKRLSLLAVI